MDILKPRKAGAAFSHYETLNGLNISIEVMADGLDAVDGQFNLLQSNSKEKDSFKAFSSGSPIVMDEVSGGDITLAATADAGVNTTFTSVGHGIPAGATIVISGTDDYDKEYPVLSVTTDTFKVGVAFVNNQTGTWTRKVYKQLSVNNFNYRYIRADWVPGNVTEGTVLCSVKVPKTEGPFGG